MRRYGIVLGGGRSSRMGVDKLSLVLEGRTLVQRVAAAALGCCEQVIVVSPPRPGLEGERVSFVLEDPPFGGPLAGLHTAVETLNPVSRDCGETEVLLLAGDLAAPGEVTAMLSEAGMGVDGLVLVDHEGWPQYLAGRYRFASLRRALDDAERLRDTSVRRVFNGLNLAMISAPKSVTMDLDTPDEARICGINRVSFEEMRNC